MSGPARRRSGTGNCLYTGGVACEDETAELLRRAGHKLTPQRMMIVRALRHAGGHISAARLAEEVHAEYPFVDLSTVYRTLDVLKRLRLVTQTDMGAGDVLFEWAPEAPHHHLICTRCNCVAELDHRYFEAFGRAVREDTGFEPDLDHFAVFGVCGGCRAREAVDADEA